MNNNLLNWSKWNSNEIINWIYSLDNGKYCHKYKDIIKNEISKQNILGKHLPSLNKLDLQSWGINDYQDRIDLLNEINNLCKDNQNANNSNSSDNNNKSNKQMNLNSNNNGNNGVLMDAMNNNEQNNAIPPPAYGQIEGQHEVTNH